MKEGEKNLLGDEEFRLLLNHFNRPWRGYRRVRKGVKKRLRRHMRELGTLDISSYLRTLQHAPQAKRECERCLQITISRFFRDHHLWLYLENILLPKQDTSCAHGIQIWSIGCGCGEEVYSLAILLGQLDIFPRYHILATDINPENLERARRGVFQISSLKKVPEGVRSHCFERDTKGQSFAIVQEYKTCIDWQKHDLFSPPPGSKFQLIFLRNSLLTYHQGEDRDQALSQILKTLVPGGYLIIGSHEKIPDAFAPILEQVPSCPVVFRHIKD